MPIKNLHAFLPRKIDFYILEEIISTFFGSTAFIIFILLMFQALRLAEYLIVHGASAIMLGKMTFFLSVSFLPTALPLSFLISILVGFGRLSADSELVALKANGYSLLRLSIPVFFLAVGVGGFSVLLNNQWVPWSVLASKNIQLKIGNTKVVTAIKEGTFTSGFFDLLLFADKVDTRTNRLHHVFIFDERESKNPLTYVAKEAEIVSLKPSSEFGAAIMLRLFNGTMHHNNLETSVYEKIDFDAYNLYLKIDEGGYTTVLKPHMIPQKELIKNIKDTTVATEEGKEFRGEYWRRYATAMSPLIFVFLGIGFGSFRQRTAKAGAIITGFMVFFVYWILQTLSTGAVLKGTLPPVIAMQVPNLVALVVGIFGFKRSSW